MAIEKEINLNVNSNIEGSIGQLKALKKELKGVDVGTEEFKKLYNQIDDLEDKIKSAKNKSSDWIDSLEQAGGPIGLLGASINKAKVATQSFGGALKATGIGLVVSLVAGLAAAFNDNEKAQKKLQPLLDGLQKIFAGVFAVVEPLFNTLVDLAVSALPMVSKAFGVVYSSVTAVFQSLGALGSAIKKLLSGDFSGAWKDAKSSVTDFGKHYDEANKRFEDGSKELTKTQKDELDKRKEDEKKHQEELAKKQKDANDKAKEERKRVAEEKKKEEEDRRNAEQSLEKKYLDDLQNLNAKSDQEKLDLQKQRDLDEINNLNTTANEKANLLALFNEKYATLQTELDDKQKAESDKNSLDKKAKDDKDAADKIKLAQDTADAELKIQQLKQEGQRVLMGKSAEVLGAFSDLLGKQTAAGKTLAIAQATINAYLGISEVWKAKNVYPEPFGTGIKIASTVVMAASAFKTVKDITAVQVPGGGGGGGSVPSGGGGASAPSAPSFNVVGNGGANQIAGVIANKEMPPIKTYVVANDVTTQQGLDNNIKSNATMG
jgi:hypothetical protein